MSEPSRGVPPSGRASSQGESSTLQFGITWDVTAILERWAHPGRAEDTPGKATLIRWWLLKVCGPLPGRPAELGEFVMEVSAYGVPPGW